MAPGEEPGPTQAGRWGRRAEFYDVMPSHWTHPLDGSPWTMVPPLDESNDAPLATRGAYPRTLDAPARGRVKARVEQV